MRRWLILAVLALLVVGGAVDARINGVTGIISDLFEVLDGQVLEPSQNP